MTYDMTCAQNNRCETAMKQTYFLNLAKKKQHKKKTNNKSY